ncbi:hypothetical protein Lpl7_2874 [Lacticaseibacillus paracasei subsp. tolerans Lpl7]|nr:hypothetical protein Lpl7_2874 [Lacticaseibacillus paracasei subsp. tolerans Lpl7]
MKRVLLNLLTPTCYHGKPNRTAVSINFDSSFTLCSCLILGAFRTASKSGRSSRTNF